MTHPGSARLQRYILGELSAEGRLAVDQHVAHCARCRELVEEERRVDEWVVGSLGGAPSAGDADAAFMRLWETLDSETPADALPGAIAGPPVESATVVQLEERRASPSARKSRRRAASLWPLAAAAAALLAVVWWMGEPGAGTGAGSSAEPSGSMVVAADEPERREPAVAPEQTLEMPGTVPKSSGPSSNSLLAVEAREVLRSLDPLPSGAGIWEPVDAARLEDARTTVGEVLRAADDQFPFATEAFRLACDEGLSELRMQGWPVAALVRGLALGADDRTAGPALRHAALDGSNLLVLARAVESESRIDDALAVLDVVPMDVGNSYSLVKALERVVAPAAAEGDQVLGAARRRIAISVLASGTGPRVRHAWDRLAGRTAADLIRLRDPDRAAAVLEEAAELWPPDVAMALLEDVGKDAKLHDPGLRAFLAHAGRLDTAAVQRLDDALARSQQVPVLLPWCVAASMRQAVPTLVRALEEGRDPDQLLPVLTVFGGPDVVAGLHGLWRDSHSPSRADLYLAALAELFDADETLAERFGASVPLEDAESLAELASALPEPSRRGLLVGALRAPLPGADFGGHRAALIVALGRTGSQMDGEDLIRWITERPVQDAVLPLAWAAAGRLAPDAAQLAWREQVGDPCLLSEVVDAVSPRLAAAVVPSARTLAPLTAALERAAAQTVISPDSLPIPNSPSMEDLP